MSQALTSRRDETQRAVGEFRGERRGSASKFLARIPLRVLVGLLLIIELYPLLWLLLSSFKTTEEFSTGAFWALPASLDWQNYALAWTSGMSTYFLNSILAVFPS